MRKKNSNRIYFKCYQFWLRFREKWNRALIQSFDEQLNFFFPTKTYKIYISNNFSGFLSKPMLQLIIPPKRRLRNTIQVVNFRTSFANFFVKHNKARKETFSVTTFRIRTTRLGMYRTLFLFLMKNFYLLTQRHADTSLLFWRPCPFLKRKYLNSEMEL